jgi:dihydropteroate synthase
MKYNNIKIMGVINFNDDSFYKKSRFNASNARKKINEMIEEGASIIDIGAVSSRPGSIEVNEQEELNRIKDICDVIKNEKLYEKVDFSVDSYSVLVVEYALKSGFSIVNDITALGNDEVAKLVASYDATVVLMHMQNLPSTMQDNPSYKNVVLDIDSFFKQRIQKAKKFGIKKIVLDVGIGFGKTLAHNCELIKKLDYFSHFGYEILMGASRKSMISMIDESAIEDRFPGTLAIHLESIKNGASIVRCHDVKEHNQAIKVMQAIS